MFDFEDPDGGGEARRTSPEHLLWTDVVTQAIRDLKSRDEVERYEAHEFFMQPKGPWAESRRHIFRLLDIDDEAFRGLLQRAKRLPTDLSEMPERPTSLTHDGFIPVAGAGTKAWTAEQVARILPDGQFKVGELRERTRLDYTILASRLHSLKKQGVVIACGDGYFEKKAWVEAGRPTPEVDTTDTLFLDDTPEFPSIIHALRDAPRTVSQLSYVVEDSYYMILKKLKNAADAGRAESIDGVWHLKESA